MDGGRWMHRIDARTTRRSCPTTWAEPVDTATGGVLPRRAIGADSLAVALDIDHMGDGRRIVSLS